LGRKVTPKGLELLWGVGGGGGGVGHEGEKIFPQWEEGDAGSNDEEGQNIHSGTPRLREGGGARVQL